jgi:hypothetical protein
MAKTDAMIPPRYLVLENSAVMTALSGSDYWSVMQSDENREVRRKHSSCFLDTSAPFDMVLTVSAYANSHHYPIEDEYANDGERG